MTNAAPQVDPAMEGGVASRRLARLRAQALEAGSVTLDGLMSAMGRSSIAFAILILSLPALTPIPGPFGMVFGTCLAIVSLQIIAGFRRIWLPSILGRRQVSGGIIDLMVRYTAPLVARVETLLRKNRMRRFAGPRAQAFLGIPVLLLAIAVALPIPFGNLFPVAALVMIALGLMERDGLVAILGVAMGVFALGATGGLVYAATWGIGTLAGS